jgi:hypothetical protein
LSHGGVHQIIGPGFAIRESRGFYVDYSGPKLAELDATVSTARFTPDGQSLVLTGYVAGRIDKRPSHGVQPLFVFGINRGGAKPPGPFPDEPKVIFDAFAAVEVTSSGIKGLVTGPNGSNATVLPAGAVQIRGRWARIQVPTRLIPSTGAPLREYEVNFWPRDLPQFGISTVIASFVPENATFPAAGPPSRGR